MKHLQYLALLGIYLQNLKNVLRERTIQIVPFTSVWNERRKTKDFWDHILHNVTNYLSDCRKQGNVFFS